MMWAEQNVYKGSWANRALTGWRAVFKAYGVQIAASRGVVSTG